MSITGIISLFITIIVCMVLGCVSAIKQHKKEYQKEEREERLVIAIENINAILTRKFGD